MLDMRTMAVWLSVTLYASQNVSGPRPSSEHPGLVPLGADLSGNCEVTAAQDFF